MADTLYIGAFRNAINIGTKEDYFDIGVGQAYVQAWREWKTGHVKKNNEAAFRLTEDIGRIFGFPRLEISASADSQTLQVLVDGRSYNLAELGARLTQFFLVLANAAVKNPSYVLIDEPELHLHPSLQLDFLTTLASYAKKGVLFATHSIGLARASAERVYLVRMTPEEGSEVTLLEATPRLSEFLGELSFSGYKELGFDKILLVEGASDVKTIQQFLRKYKRDHEIVLLPLGGSTLINKSAEAQLQEIKRISQNVFALIDSERSAANASLSRDREDFVQACKSSGIECHVLDRRAIENYLPEGAIRKVKGDKHQALQPYERLDQAKYGWAKSENWRIAQQMTKEDLTTTDLGEFLASL
ncbi:MAG: AAA family ATPase [Chloroflexota bacterium]